MKVKDKNFTIIIKVDGKKINTVLFKILKEDIKMKKAVKIEMFIDEYMKEIKSEIFKAL